MVDEISRVSARATAYVEQLGGSVTELERELRRLVRKWQGADRCMFVEEKRPPWWLPGTHVEGVLTPEKMVTIPPFKGSWKKKQDRWKKEAVHALIGLAVDAFFDTNPNITLTADDSFVLNSSQDLSNSLLANQDAPAAPVSRERTPSPEPRKPKPARRGQKTVVPSRSEPAAPRSTVAEQKGTPSRETSDEDRGPVPHGRGVRRGGEPQFKTPSAVASNGQDTPPTNPILRRAYLACEELDTEVEKRCGIVAALVETLIGQLKATYVAQIVKIPQRVRKMPLSEFVSRYDGDTELFYMSTIREMVKSALGPDAPAADATSRHQKPSKPPNNAENDKENFATPAAATFAKSTTARRQRARRVALEAVDNAQPRAGRRAAQKANQRIQATLRTPAHQVKKLDKEGVAPPTGTTARRRRPGEQLLSENGSPVVVGDSPALPQRRKDAAKLNGARVKALQLQNGAQVDLETINDRDRKVAAEVLETLALQMAEIQAKLRNHKV